MLLTHVLLDTAKYRLNIDSTLINDNPLFNVLCKDSILEHKLYYALYKNKYIVPETANLQTATVKCVGLRADDLNG